MNFLNELQRNTPEKNLNALLVSSTELFAERKGNFLNEYSLFMAHFKCIPNSIDEIKIDCKKANDWFLNTYKEDIINVYYNKRYYRGNKKAEFDDLFYILNEDLIFYIDINCSLVKFLYRKTNFKYVETLIDGIKKFRKKYEKGKPKINIIVHSSTGIEIKTLQIRKPALNIEDNYNEDFKEIHQTIIKRLSRKNDKGLVLLHGKPGTGKTSYIRYLISSVKKNVIFLPPNMAGAIANPEFVSILIDNPNSIFVIEDAENIVVDREKDGRSPVSALLNISDGLLSDFLNIQVICSFNTDISKVDNALMRKGRLIAKYEFGELAVEKARSLSEKLGFKTYINTPMILGAIYNQGEKDFQPVTKRNAIGFNIVNEN